MNIVDINIANTDKGIGFDLSHELIGDVINGVSHKEIAEKYAQIFSENDFSNPSVTKKFMNGFLTGLLEVISIKKKEAE